ncbi:MAG: hypothetical protein R3F11_30245 [Verrucomicrobiales bacterium]
MPIFLNLGAAAVVGLFWLGQKALFWLILRRGDQHHIVLLPAAGACYAIRGLKAVAVSDTINGIGLGLVAWRSRSAALIKLGGRQPRSRVTPSAKIAATAQPGRRSRFADPMGDAFHRDHPDHDILLVHQPNDRPADLRLKVSRRRFRKASSLLPP